MMRLSPLINIHYMAKISGFQTKSMGRKKILTFFFLDVASPLFIWLQHLLFGFVFNEVPILNSRITK